MHAHVYCKHKDAQPEAMSQNVHYTCNFINTCTPMCDHCQYLKCIKLCSSKHLPTGIQCYVRCLMCCFFVLQKC